MLPRFKVKSMVKIQIELIIFDGYIFECTTPKKTTVIIIINTLTSVIIT